MAAKATFHVTPHASATLTDLLSTIDIESPVLALNLRPRGVKRELRWGIEILVKSEMPPEAAIVVAGAFNFYFDPVVEKELNGRTLDVVNGRFEVVS